MAAYWGSVRWLDIGLLWAFKFGWYLILEASLFVVPVLYRPSAVFGTYFFFYAVSAFVLSLLLVKATSSLDFVEGLRVALSGTG